MKVIKIDGTVFIGELGENAINDAVAVGTDLTATITANKVAAYTKLKNLGELISMTFNNNTSAVASRDLKPEEVQLFMVADFAMETAKNQAVPNIENQFFTENFKGK